MQKFILRNHTVLLQGLNVGNSENMWVLVFYSKYC